MQDPFDQKKESILREIGATNEVTPDASPKGTIDVKCLPIINTINANHDMVTTSSCSGRVSVFLEGIKKQEGQIGAKGHEGRWLFVTHDAEELPQWWEAVDFVYGEAAGSTSSTPANTTRFILYKFEPLILHVKCRTLEMANRLYAAAMGCGFRESGIGTNNIVAIRISIRLDVPIGYMSTDDQMVSFVNKQYLEMVTKLSLDRFEENDKKLVALEQCIRALDVAVATPVEETKEERRERKMREGMARREGVRAEKEKKKAEKAAEQAAKQAEETPEKL